MGTRSDPPHAVPAGQDPAADTPAGAAGWARLPAWLGPALAAQLDLLALEVLDAVRAEVPFYSRPLEGDFGLGIQLGIHEALRQFCLLVETGGRGETGGLGVYDKLGRGEWRQGRPLDALLAAYRVGARVSWHRFALVGAEAGLATEELVALAELVFAHIDELSAASADGYADEQSAQAGERDRRRAALARLLLAPRTDRASVLAAARAAAWPVPTRLCVVVAPADTGGRSLAGRFGPDVLPADTDQPVLIVGDPLPRGRLLATLAGTGAVVGPVRPLAGAAASRDRALALLALRARGLVAAAPRDPVLADEHLGALVLHADEAAGADLAARLLAPLDELATTARQRLEETLLAWLLHAGERARAAAALHVHPQTVRYRMGRVRELLGDSVDDPRARLGLLMALQLRADQAQAAGRGGEHPPSAAADDAA